MDQNVGGGGAPEARLKIINEKKCNAGSNPPHLCRIRNYAAVLPNLYL